MDKIGFIALDGLDKSMVRSLMNAGYTVYIYTENYEKAADVIEEGAIFCRTVKACMEECEAIVKTIGYIDNGKNINVSADSFQ